MEFVTQNLPLLLSAVFGLIFLVAEAFIPGFGVAGILGIILEIVASWLIWSRFGAAVAILFILGFLLVLGVIVFLSYRSALHGRLSKSALVLPDAETPAEDDAVLRALIGQEAVAVTPLRPAGTVLAGDRRFPAAGTGDFIAKDTRVRITGVSGDHLTVSPL